MLGRLVLGGIALTAAGYGLAKYFKDNYTYGTTEEKAATQTELERFYKLKQSVYNGSYQEFQNIIAKIENLDLDNKKNITLKNTIPKTENYKDEINSTANMLYLLLGDCNDRLRESISKISDMIKISSNYPSYSKEAKKTLSDALVISGVIVDILNVDIIEEEEKPSKSSKELITQVNKVLENIDKG